MVSSTAPRFDPRCPPLAATVSIRTAAYVGRKLVELIVIEVP